MKIDIGEWELFLKEDYELGLEEGWLKPNITIKKRIDKEQIKQAFELLKKDLQDLGKWRKFKELKRDLENE